MAPCPAGRVDALWVVFACWPIERACYGGLSDRCRDVREESTPGRRMIEIEVCGHWACSAWLYAFIHELGGITPQPCDEGFDAGGIRSAPPTTLAATELNVPQSERGETHC